MLTIRKRGLTYHCRGTVRIGKETRIVQEHSTGCRERAAAEVYKAKLEREIQEDLLHGPAGRTKRIAFAEVGQIYIDREAGLHRNDIWRIGELNEVLGDVTLADIAEGWAEFRKKRCAGLAPATINRFRDTLQAALNYASEELRYVPPKVKAIPINGERIRWLTLAHAELLVSSYAEHVQPIALTFRFQGCRTQEALQLQWPNVDLQKETIFLERTKNSEPRTVKMHPRVVGAIWAIWKERDQPDLGPVFLNRLGKPYSDTRDYKLPGGNPLRKAHATAVSRAAKKGLRPNGGPDFIVHDWRHHWASRCVMEGIDLITIAKMGGWKDLRMVQRYASVSTEHMSLAISKLR